MFTASSPTLGSPISSARRYRSKPRWGGRAVLVLVGVRLGIDGVNPIYYDTIKVRSFAIPSFQFSYVLTYRLCILFPNPSALQAVDLLHPTISSAPKLTIFSTLIRIMPAPQSLYALLPKMNPPRRHHGPAGNVKRRLKPQTGGIHYSKINVPQVRIHALSARLRHLRQRVRVARLHRLLPFLLPPSNISFLPLHTRRLLFPARRDRLK